MKKALKFARGSLVTTAVVICGPIGLFLLLGLFLDESLLRGGVIEGIKHFLVGILFFGFLLAPLLVGYLLVRRDAAGMPSIGFAAGVIPPTLLFVYYMFDPPSGGISAVMTILFIPILAIVSGVVMAVLAALVGGAVNLWRMRRPPSL
jgi:hypothetical protein